MVTPEFALFVLKGNGTPRVPGLIGAPMDTWLQLNTQKPLYKATVEAMKHIIDYGWDKHYGFEIQFNSGPGQIFKDYWPTAYKKCEEFFIWYCNNVPVEKRPFWDYRLNRYEKLVQRPVFQSPTKLVYIPGAKKVAIKETLNYLCSINLEEKIQTMSTTTSDSKKEKTALQIVLPDTAVLNANYSAAKAAMEKIVGDIASVTEIKDPGTAKFLSDKTIELNGALGKIEDVRKFLKSPFLDKGKEIDAIAKDIRSGGEEQLSRAKKLLLAWDTEQQRLQKEREQEAAKKRTELTQNASNVTAQLSEQQRLIINTEKELFDALTGAKTREELGKIFRERLSLKTGNFYMLYDKQLSAEQKFGEFAKEAEDMRVRMVNLGKAHDALLNAQSSEVTATKLQLAQLEYTKIKAEIGMAVIKAHEQLNEKVETKTEETVLTAEVQKATITSEVTLQAPEQTINKRRMTRYEVVDFTAVPDSFKMINDERVKAFIGDKKELLTTEMNKNNGSVIVDGLRFFFEDVPVIPRSH